jgi:hypothetical protein
MGTFFAPGRDVDQERINGTFDDNDEDDDFWAQADRAYEVER